MQKRTVRLVAIRPDHPARTRQHNNAGERYRDEGAVSEVHINVDLGLKTGAMGIVAMSVEQAVKHVAMVAQAISQAIEVNAREGR